MSELQTLLTELTTKFVEEYKGKLSGSNIGSSLTFEVIKNGNLMQCVLNIDDYWKWIEYGRGGTLNPHSDGVSTPKPPPISEILKWVQRKNIMPINPKLGQESVAWAIRRHIGLNGIKARPYIKELTISIYEANSGAIKQALQNDLNNGLL